MWEPKEGLLSIFKGYYSMFSMPVERKKMCKRDRIAVGKKGWDIIATEG